MHAVIINTLGKEYAKKDVYFRAFLPEQVSWIDSSLPQIGACRAAIADICNKKTTRQDYHLVILASLEHFGYYWNTEARDVLERILNTYLLSELITPLVEADCVPKGVSAVFTFHQDSADGEYIDNNLYSMYLESDRESKGTYSFRYDDSQILRIPKSFDPAAKELQKDDPSEKEPGNEPVPAKDTDDKLDELEALEMELKKEQANSKKKNEEKKKLEGFTETQISRDITDMQSIKLPDRGGLELKPDTQCFCFPTSDVKLCNADIQINLARLIASLLNSGTNKAGAEPLRFEAHDHETFANLVAKEVAVLDKMDQIRKEQLYYPLEVSDSFCGEVDLQADIMDGLRQQGIDLPGTQNTPADGNVTQIDNADKEEHRGIRKIWDGMWAAFKKQQKRFSEAFTSLMDQYDPDAIKKEQEQIFDCCSDVYIAWKNDHTGDIKALPENRTEIKRPVLREVSGDEFEKTKQLCADGVLEQLKDYEDVRDEALTLLQRSKEIERCWSPDGLREENNRSFRRFSVIMGLIFILIMIVPYILIDSNKIGFPPVKALFYAICFGVLVLIYGAGIYIWNRKRTEKLRELTCEMEDLIKSSSAERKESVLRAVEVYGKLLPKLVRTSRKAEALEKIDNKNEDIERKQRLHSGYINDARKELKDICTALRIGMPSTRDVDPGSVKFDSNLPPYDPYNRSAYLLFVEGEDNQ